MVRRYALFLGLVVGFLVYMGVVFVVVDVVTEPGRSRDCLKHYRGNEPLEYPELVVVDDKLFVCGYKRHGVYDYVCEPAKRRSCP